MFNNIQEFNTKANNIEISLISSTMDYEQLVYETIESFYGSLDKNINVIQRLTTIAYNAQGIRAKTVIDYLSQIIPHKVVKDVVNKRRFTFAGKDKRMSYPSMEEVNLYMEEYKLFDETNKNDEPEVFNFELKKEKLIKNMYAQIKVFEKNATEDTQADTQLLTHNIKIMIKSLQDNLIIEEEVEEEKTLEQHNQELIDSMNQELKAA